MILAPGETCYYRGYQLIIDHADILVIAPNGDIACFPSMVTVRKWVKRHRQTHPK